MLELFENRFILTTDDGKMIACYTMFEDAKMDAKGLISGGASEKYHVYVLINSTKIGDPYLQKTYELKQTYPLPPEEVAPMPEEKPLEGEAALPEEKVEASSTEEKIVEFKKVVDKVEEIHD